MHQIGSSNNSSAVKEQYATSRGLDTRISFHDKYSTNKQGYGNWIFSHYEIREGMHILEIGCGNGSLWMGHDDDMARCGRLVLTDLSEGMLSTAKAHLGERDNICYMLADIQDIPFEDNSFDMVIANAMLYHVPDLDQGLREVRRVLKDGGAFCCATFGEHNFAECLAEWFRLDAEHFQPNHNFTLENGTQQLQTYFSEVQTLYYEDALHVTDIEDLVEYLRSLASFKAIIEIPVPRIREILEKHAQDGVIDLPKEYGMFICR